MLVHSFVELRLIGDEALIFLVNLLEIVVTQLLV
jgi:hypothetical protein